MVSSCKIDFRFRTDSNLKLRFLTFAYKSDFYTQIYVQLNLNINHFTINLCVFIRL